MRICRICLLQVVLFCFILNSVAQKRKIKPVTPNASPEVKALLEFIYDFDDKYILAGQHNYPISRDKNTRFAARYIGKTPPVWSQDFGFSAEGDKDSYLSRPSIVEEAIRQHKKGSVINLCWHAVPPTADEPITFQPLPGSNPDKLESVQGKLTESRFKDLLTPGTKINKHWLKQVDEIASFLKQLQDAKIPVIWRPYHEMNGDWFWWGGRYEGKYTTAELYKQIYDRMANYHKLNNLIWVWSVDRANTPERKFDNFFPGTQYFDIAALDVYGSDFAQEYYDKLVELADGKPVTLAEVGNPPTVNDIDNQPKWAYWVVWAGMTRNISKGDYDKLINHPQVLFMEDPEYIEGINKFRKECGLEPLKMEYHAADFSGEWLLNEYVSEYQNAGMFDTPYKLSIKQANNSMSVKSYTYLEWTDAEIKEYSLSMDGKDTQAKIANNMTYFRKAQLSDHKDTLTVTIKNIFNGKKTKETVISEKWSLQRHGEQLRIEQTINHEWGTKTYNLVYDKQ